MRVEEISEHEIHEILGMLDFFTMSAIVYIAKHNISLQAINMLKVKIEYIKSILWAIVGVSIGKEENSQETFLELKKQLEAEMEVFLKLCNDIKSFGLH